MKLDVIKSLALIGAALRSGLQWVSAEVPAAKRDGRPRRAREGG